MPKVRIRKGRDQWDWSLEIDGTTIPNVIGFNLEYDLTKHNFPVFHAQFAATELDIELDGVNVDLENIEVK
jgi:hypothetical protein